MEKINSNILKKTEDVLLLDKKIKHNGFLCILERDIKNLLDIYFSMEGSKPIIKLSKGGLGTLNVTVTLENVKPKKVGINA